jgi:SAM-dependent methyltransferase
MMWPNSGHWPVICSPATVRVCGTRDVLFCGFTANLRETGACSQCGASNRQRQMALALRTGLGIAPVGRLALPNGFRLYSAEANGPLHTVLADSPGYICSEYWDDTQTPGASANGVRHEDLQRLSFADNTFDIVLTSDVLEHVDDAYQAHSEILRVRGQAVGTSSLYRSAVTHMTTCAHDAWTAGSSIWRSRCIMGTPCDPTKACWSGAFLAPRC